MKTVRALGLITLVFILTSCASTTDKAHDLYDSGDFESAIKMYEKAIREDRGDTEAIAGLHAARLKWVDTRLIMVRKRRLSGNMQSAVDLLHEVFQKEAQWGISPENNAFSTQLEESDLLSNFLRKEIAKRVKPYPVAAGEMLRKYKAFYSTSKKMATHRKLSQLASENGKKECGRLRKLERSDLPYLMDFIHRYCNYWGINTGDRSFTDLTANLSESFSGVEINGRVRGLDESTQFHLVKQMEDGFQQSPWFNPRAKKTLRVRLSGRFKNYYRKYPVSIAEEYSVRVPYIVYESSQQPYQEAYIDTEYRYDTTTNKMKKERVTKYRTKHREIKKAVTKYRNETRVEHVDGYHYSQRLNLSGSLQARLGKVKFHVPFSKETSSEGEAHYASLPSLGISPKPENTVNAQTWVGNIFNKMAPPIETNLQQAWISSFCGGNLVTATEIEFLESSMKCMRAHKATAGDQIDNWYMKKHGLRFRSLYKAIGEDEIISNDVATL